MTAQTPFKRLILRAVLRNVSPMMIRVLAVPDYLDLPEFDEVFRTVLGWDGLGFIFEFTATSTTVFAVYHPGRKRCGISNCVCGRSFSTPAARSIFGNGGSGFWTKKRE